MKKILHIVGQYYPAIGGIETIARDMVFSLRNNYINKVICLNVENKTIHRSVDGVEVVYCSTFLKISSQRISWTFYSELKKILTDMDPDIVVFHFPNPLMSTVLMMLMCERIKLIVYWHSDIVKQKIIKKFFYFNTIQLLNRADRIVATSPDYVEGSDFLFKFKEKVCVIPNFVNEYRIECICKQANNKQFFSKDKFKCIAVGRLVEYKGFDYLIDAFKFLDDDKYELLLVGSGPLFEKLKKKVGEKSNIKLMGRLSDRDLYTALSEADICCFSSITRNEAFGVSLAEAMYFGLPSVTFTIKGSGVNFVSPNRITGIEVRNKDIEAYKNAIIELKSNGTLRTLYSKNAKNRISKLFSFKIFNKNIANLLSEF